MNKFAYGSFDSNNTDIAFAYSSGYGDPSSEIETRKQLSYPLKEVKTYLNNTIPTDSSDNPVQLVVSSSGLKYRTEPNGALSNVASGVSFSDIYPIGSIYMSVNNTNPSTLFTGTTWTQITTDAYLKIVTSNGGQAGGTSSEHKIPVESMPAHTHTYTTYNTIDVQRGTKDTNVKYPNTSTGTTSSTGGGEAYYPYYFGVYLWKRTA